MKSDLSKIIAKVRNTRDYENLKARLGRELGGRMLQLVTEAELVDKELDLVHKCLTRLYEIDKAVPEIQKCLLEIEKLRNNS